MPSAPYCTAVRKLRGPPLNQPSAWIQVRRPTSPPIRSRIIDTAEAVCPRRNAQRHEKTKRRRVDLAFSTPSGLLGCSSLGTSLRGRACSRLRRCARPGPSTPDAAPRRAARGGGSYGCVLPIGLCLGGFAL